MAIKGLGRKTSKSPNFFSHEFIIQNHADIVSCIAMVFVLGLMASATTSIASIFIVMQHNVTGSEPTAENPRGEPFVYEAGWKDGCAVFFYTLICIILHAILQEYVLDKISKKLHLSKFKLSRFNESGQLVVFYLVSFIWGSQVVLREQYLENVSKLWSDFPNHPMSFLHKLFFVIQLSYYLHMLPELYFQKVKKDEQPEKLKHSLAGFLIVSFMYFLGYGRVAVVLSTLHYVKEFISHAIELVDIFDRDEKFVKFPVIKNLFFVVSSFVTLVLSFLTFFYGIGNINFTRGLLGLIVTYSIQGVLIFRFITSFLKSKRESKEQSAKQAKKLKSTSSASNSNSAKNEKVKSSVKNRKKESDLPEADQQVKSK